MAKKNPSSLSVVLITLNEEKNIPRCLGSLAPLRKIFPNLEILVGDSHSQDRTASLARSFGAKVIVRPWEGYAKQKNDLIALAKGDWVLSIDADEELTPALVQEMERMMRVAPPEVEGFLLKRKAFFLGKWIKHCGWWPDSQLRLVRRGKGSFTLTPVHEGMVVRGGVLELEEPMNHYTYDSIQQYLKKLNRYSDLSLLKIKPKKIKLWPFYLVLSPWITFFRMFVAKWGFLDGWHGFVVCALSAYHDFCKYAKLWEKEVLKRNP
jgi:glycosyltransferase involved in cell wall biosynthesis